MGVYLCGKSTCLWHPHQCRQMRRSAHHTMHKPMATSSDHENSHVIWDTGIVGQQQLHVTHQKMFFHQSRRHCLGSILETLFNPKKAKVSIWAQKKPGIERVQALADISHLTLCCHSNETCAPIANLPNSAQLECTLYPTILQLTSGPVQ